MVLAVTFSSVIFCNSPCILGKANKASSPRQGIIFALRVHKWTIFEPETHVIFVLWWASRHMEIHSVRMLGALERPSLDICSSKQSQPSNANTFEDAQDKSCRRSWTLGVCGGKELKEADCPCQSTAGLRSGHQREIEGHLRLQWFTSRLRMQHS